MRFNPYITFQASVIRQPSECVLFKETLAKYFAILPSPADGGGNYEPTYRDINSQTSVTRQPPECVSFETLAIYFVNLPNLAEGRR